MNQSNPHYWPDTLNGAFTVRPATAADLPHVCAIDDAAFSPYGTAESSDIFAARLAAFPDGFLVAENDGLVVGYGTSEKWADERLPEMNENPLATHDPNGRIFCITAMAVREPSRNRGIACLVLRRLIDIARAQNCNKVVLETTHAQGFYLKRGFRIAGEKQQWGVPLAIMQLDL